MNRHMAYFKKAVFMQVSEKQNVLETSMIYVRV